MLSDPRISPVVKTAVVILVVATFARLAETDAGLEKWWIAAGVILCAVGLIAWLLQRART